ncbi:hypothetical protein A9Q93_11900 [Nonlabens dokdonensis]|uniref:Uncharacterized protein n=1 Tax=Nonlabens dokdonensis TaxID=328515 RepID=A0A1Z8ALN9_9FLAO|nr:hypothetical protein [Nonlabens dokdonensis]OUS11088.1 hypothetical protein A9Q93_11900 [Nonlabens dokdonensis]
MNIKTLNIIAPALLIFFNVSCKKKEARQDVPANYPTTYTYEVSLEPVQENITSPALQSFVHATHGEDWILFAGRTNGENDSNGGLHDLTADYSLKSFPPKSFNSNIYVFNPKTGNKATLDYRKMVENIYFMGDGGNDASTEIQKVCTLVGDKLSQYGSIFLCSNPQVLQTGDDLYVIGGYGAPVGEVPTAANYHTFDAIAKINVPLLSRLVQGDYSLTTDEWMKVFKFGNNPSLRITGGELKKAGNEFYLAGGHNFNNNEQVYLNSVYQLEFSDSKKSLDLTATVTDTISDLTATQLKDLKLADSTSIFRRRDLPVTSSVYMDKDSKLAPNFALMSGVFKYHFAAWNDAIYITPDADKKYKVDNNHNQKDCNVYSCPDFTIYDSSNSEIHTFLPGGIGNGKADDHLSGFTNTLGYSKYNLKSLESSFDTISKAFPSKYYYGAEAVFIPNSNAKYLSIDGVEADVIDSEKTFTNSQQVEIGHIYGGIEAYEDSPSTYGSGKSGASNKIWKVTVTRIPIEFKK